MIDMPVPATITLEEFLAGHGGSRPGAGRKSEYGQRQQPVSIFLSQEHYDFLLSYPAADSNASEAVRLMCEKYRDTPLAPRRVRIVGEGRVHTSITVPDYMRDYLKELGKGQFASGIRLLIEMELLLQNKNG